MSRPKKPARAAQGDLRAFDIGADEWMAQVARQLNIDTLRADPLNDEPLAGTFGHISLRLSRRSAYSARERGMRQTSEAVRNGFETKVCSGNFAGYSIIGASPDDWQKSARPASI